MVTLTNVAGFFGPSAGTGLTYDFSQISWSSMGSFSVEPSVDIGFAGGGIYVGADYDVDLGLTGAAHLDLGKMETSMVFDGSTAVVTEAGKGATFDSAKLNIISHSVEASGPSAAESYVELGISADLMVNLDIRAFAWYDVLFDSGRTDGTIFQGNVIDIDTDFTILPRTTLDIIGGLDGNILTVALGDYLEAKLDLPEFEYDDAEYVTVEGKPDTVILTGESTPFATLEFGLASLLGIGPFGESVDIGFIEAGIEVGLFDAKLVAEATLVQEIEIESEIEFSMTTTLNDDVITGKMGDAFTFDTPEGEGEFQVTVDYTLIETISSIMSLRLAAYIDWKLVLGEAFINISAISEKFSFEVALVEDRIDLDELLGLGISFELTNTVDQYRSDAGTETYTVRYENFVTAASGADLKLTTNQVEILGGKIDNTITGNDLDNRLNGGAGNDTIKGGKGDDTLIGGLGNDVLSGAIGRDTVAYLASTSKVVVELAAGFATGQGFDKLIGIENVSGSTFGDYIAGDEGRNVLRGNAGDDTIDGGAGNDTIDGGSGHDYLTGGEGIDTVTYLSSTFGGVHLVLGTDSFVGDSFFTDVITGFENVTGSKFEDHITGDDFANVLRGSNGNDTVLGAGGNDTLDGGFGDDLLEGGQDHDRVDGAEGFDVLFGDDGNDTIYGGQDQDQLYGGDGDDVLNGGMGGDYMDGGAGIDTVDYDGSISGVIVTVDGLVAGQFDAEGDVLIGIENLSGSAFSDIFYGDDAANTFWGKAGDDSFYGGNGADTMDGGVGNDYMDGGAGDDIFIFSKGEDTVIGDDGLDEIHFNQSYLNITLSSRSDGRIQATDLDGNAVAFGTSTEYMVFTEGYVHTGYLFA